MVSATIRASASDTTAGYRPSGGRFRSSGGVVRDADHAGASVGADDGADVADDHLVARVQRLEQFDELVEVGGIAVTHGEVLDGARLANLVGDVAQGP